MVVVGIVVVVVVVMVVVLVLGRPLSPARLIGCWSNPLGFLRPPETINLQARWTRHPVWWCRYFHSIGIDSSPSARRAAKPGQGREKRNNHSISCPSCPPDSLPISNTCGDSPPSFVLHHPAHLALLDSSCLQSANHITLLLSLIRHGLLLLRSRFIVASSTLLPGSCS
jgi:hypothetical protein